MYISSFHIDGFGIFSQVDVENLSPGISIFLGRNEAGKSTCLEFLRTMLTGYPEPRSKESRRSLAPLAGGLAGGSLVLKCPSDGENEEIRLTRRPNSAGGLSLFDVDGKPLPSEVLSRILSGVSREVYRKVFGFSLSELENLESLSAEEVRNALYGASFGPGLRSPGEVLKMLKSQKDEIFKPSGSKQPLNSSLRQLEDLRANIVEWQDNCSSYDELTLKLNEKMARLLELRNDRKELEAERRSLERRLGVWRQWDQWRALKARLEGMGQDFGNFPEDAAARLARVQEARDACERQLAARREKLAILKERRDKLVVNEPLLAVLPELRRLAERKTSYRQALIQINGVKESCGRAQSDLEHGLGQLGPGWDCQRIRSTDRSLFVHEDMEKQAREMNAADLAHQAAIDSLAKINREVEACKRALNTAQEAFDILPEPAAILSGQERDELRQNMARLEENRRLEPGRERALQAARNAFSRALEHANIAMPKQSGNEAERHEAARGILDGILARQDDALAVAGDMQQRLTNASEAGENLRKAEDNAEKIRHRMDEIRAAQRNSTAPGRDMLDARMLALRTLRGVSSNIDAEKERLAELDARLENEKEPARAINWVLIVFGLLFLAAAAAIFVAHRFWGIAEFVLTPDVFVPINLWAAYVALACGVILFAGAAPGRGAELRRHKEEIAKLSGRRESSAMRLADLEAQCGQLCQTAGVDSPDPIAMDATEMLIERQKEQFFHEERSRQEMKALEHDFKLAREQVLDSQAMAQAKENEVQQCRRRWHDLMQSLEIKIVPSPESASTFFARAEAARLAYDNVANAQRELDALCEDLRALERTIRANPVIAGKMEDSTEELSLEAAVRLTLESCRDADLAREQKMRAENILESARNDMGRAQERQEDASKHMDACGERFRRAQENWRKCLEGLGLGEDLNPETVREAFKYMENCLAAEERLSRSKRELAQCETELAAMREPMRSITAGLDREIVKDSDANPDWLVTLDNLLEEAQRNEGVLASKSRLEMQLEEEAGDLASEEAAFASACAKEKALLGQAGADNAEDFLRMAGLYAEKIDLRRNMENLESSLRIAADGQPFGEFLESFSAEDQETQELRLAEINNRLEKIIDEEQLTATTAGTLQERVQSLSGAEDMATMRQEEFMLLEGMNRMALAWSKRALAEELIRKAKHIFERERQPEVIRLASRIFSIITDNKWIGLSASLEDSTLCVLPAHGEPVKPENLSRGAQEQAYLALRLAYIQNHAEHAMSLPVIMDEILVNFDPERAERAAHAFADLANGQGWHEQQVFYFTCQPHMADILKSVSPHSPLYIVENGSIRAA